MIELNGVSFSYPDGSKAISGISIKIKKGKINVITGGNGTGKTTLLNILAGAVPHAILGSLSGDVILDGNKNEQFEKFTSKISLVSQDAEKQIISSTVYEELRIGLWFQGKNDSQAKKWAKHFGITEKQVHSAKLSGGEKQRVLLASTLALEKEVIILDEPFANLDKHNQDALMHALKKLREQGKTIVISSSRKQANKITDHSINLGQHAEFVWKPNQKSGKETIAIKNASFEYLGKPVITRLNHSFHRGLNVITGKNGSGKTTLLKLAAGLIKPTEGKINAATNYCFVFQNPTRQVFAPTVFDEVAAGLKWKNKFNEQKVMKALNKFGFTNPKERTMTLSHGQKKRLCFASAYADDAQVIFLDEPFLGLDAKASRLVAKTIQEWQKTKTVIVATHEEVESELRL